MSIFLNYIKPKTVQEAVRMISRAEGSQAVVAGGTDLLLDIRQGRHQPVDLLIDVSEVDEMRQVYVKNGWVYLGAAVTHKQIISHPLLKENTRCLVEGCGLIGGPQVRNVATIGGNVAHALPAGDGTVSLLALDTEVQLASAEGNRWLPLIDIFDGPGDVTFDREQEIITAFRFREKGNGEASAFKRVMRPQGVAIAILNAAAWVKVTEGRFEDVRLSVGPAGPKPFRGYRTEKVLRGHSIDGEFFPEAVKTLADEVSLRTSTHRATKEYRHQLLPVLLQQVLESAVSRSVGQVYRTEVNDHE